MPPYEFVVAGFFASAEIGSEAGEYTNWLRLLLIGSFLSGIVALAYEIIWTHVLSFLIGNTVYAFGLMLFTFLCGLGARIVAHHLKRPELWPHSLVASQVLLGLVVFGTLAS